MARALGPSLRRGFLWNLSGALVYNLAQWLLLVVLARLSTTDEVGRFTLVLAISAPIFLATGLNLRTLQVTDAQRRYTLEEYFVLRNILSVVGATITIAAGIVLDLDIPLLLALMAMSVAKVVEGLSVSCYGYMAVRHRFDLSSQSSIMRGLVGPVFFAIGYLATDQLWGAGLGLALGWGAVQVLWDMPWTRRLASAEGRPLRSWRTARPKYLKDMARRALPLGIDQGVSSYSINAPRYAVQSSLGSASLGIYAAQAYLAQVITLVTMSMMGVLVPRLSHSFAEGRRRAFINDILRLAAVGVGLCAIAVVGSVLLGRFVVSATLGQEYVNQPLLIALMVAAGAITLQRVLSKGLEASHRFASYLLVDIVTLCVIALSLVPLIALYGVVGAALATTLGYLIGAIVMAGFLIKIVSQMSPMPMNVGIEDSSSGDGEP